MFERKTTTNGRRPQNIESWISQHPLVWFSSNFKLKLTGLNKNQKCLKQRWPPMEGDLNIFKVEYLSNHWLDLPQILNLSIGDQNKMENCLNWRWPPMEEELKILKVEYLSNYWSDLPQFLNYVIYEFSGEIIGKLKGNLECGLAQPSLSIKYCIFPLIIDDSFYPWV